MSTHPTYSIKTVEDFLIVPADRVSTCLSEFILWIETAKQCKELFSVAADCLFHESAPEMQFAEFIWIDDGEKNITIKMQQYAKDAEEDSLTSKFLEPMWQPLFDLMDQEHGVTLLETECGDIAEAVDESRIKDGVPIFTLQKYLRALSQEELLTIGHDIARHCGHELRPIQSSSS